MTSPALAERQRDQARDAASRNRWILGILIGALILVYLGYRYVWRLDLYVDDEGQGATVLLDFNWRTRDEERREPHVRVAEFSVCNRASTLFHRGFHLSVRVLGPSGAESLKLRGDQALLYIGSLESAGGSSAGGEVSIDPSARAGAHRYAIFFNPAAIEDVDLANVAAVQDYVPIHLQWEVAVLRTMRRGGPLELGTIPVQVELNAAPEEPTVEVRVQAPATVTHRVDQEVVAATVELRSTAGFRCSRRVRLDLRADVWEMDGEQRRSLTGGARFGEAQLTQGCNGSVTDASLLDDLSKVALSRGAGFQETLIGSVILDTEGLEARIPNPKGDSDQYQVSVVWEPADV